MILAHVVVERNLSSAMEEMRKRKINLIMKLLFVLLFILPSICYSQRDTSKQVIGKLYTTQGGDYSVTVIFHRNKQAIAVMDTRGDSLQKIFDFVEGERKKFGNDIIANYDRITYHKPGSKKIELDVTPYNQKDFATKNNINQEIDNLKNLNFISGNIYFSGVNFTNVIAARVSEKAKLEMNYRKSGPGTTITLENCVYKNSNGTLSAALNKSIKLN